MIGFSASLPWVRSETNIDFANTWTKILGNHTVKFGVDLRRVRDALLQEQTFSPRGLYTFNDGQTALNTGSRRNRTPVLQTTSPAFCSTCQGRRDAIWRPSSRTIEPWQFFTFVQDKWLVTPKFSADIGVRWEFYPPATPAAKGGFSNYNPANNTLIVSGIRRQSERPGDRDALQILRASHGTGLPFEGIDSLPRWIRHQLYAVSRQQLRLQFPGAGQ